MKDLFETPEMIPANVQRILNTFDDNADPCPECDRVNAELNEIGYAFDWGLDGQPTDLHKINGDKLAQDEIQIREFAPEARFLSLSVFKFPLGDCGGITDHMGKASIYIPCEDGPWTFGTFTEEEQRHIFIPEQRGADYWAVKPLIHKTGMNGPMAGGNLAYSSDSRCTRVYHIHDRFEAWR